MTLEVLGRHSESLGRGTCTVRPLSVALLKIYFPISWLVLHGFSVKKETK